MRKAYSMRGVVDLVILLACAAVMAACQIGVASTEDHQDEAQAPTPQDGTSLVIENDSPLPETYPQANYEVHLRAHGGVPVLHWRLERGALPRGIKLEDDGLLHGQPERTGEFQFTASVRD